MPLSRRSIVAALAAVAGGSLLARRPPIAKAEEQAMPTYEVDLDELRRAFPNRSGPASLPALLTRFGKWLGGKPWRSVGSFDLALQWSDSGFPGGERHYDEFALVIRLPDGSAAGYWLAGGD